MSLTGFTLILISALLHAAWNLVARKVGGSIAVIFFGLCVACLLAMPIAWYLSVPSDFTQANFLDAVVGGVMVGIYVIFLGAAYGVEELTFVYPISRGIGVAGISLVGAFWLGEAYSVKSASGLGLVLLGTIAVGMDRNRKAWARGLTLSLLSGAALVASYALGKLIVDSMTPMAYAVGSFSVCALTLGIAVVASKKNRAQLPLLWREQKLASGFIGIAAFTSTLLVLFAFRVDSASLLIGVREISVAIAALGSFWWLKEPMTPKKLWGTAAIVGGALLLKG